MNLVISTLVALVSLGRIANADEVQEGPDEPSPVSGAADPSASATRVEAAPVYGATSNLMLVSGRGISQNYLVLSEGSEVTAQLRLVTAEPVLGSQPLRLTDLGLFDLAARVSLTRSIEIAGSVTLLPKQPFEISETPWQHASLALRKGVGGSMALALSGNVGQLLNHPGVFTREALMLEWRKPINSALSFSLAGGASGITLSSSGERGGLIGEVGGTASALARAPNGVWGGWLAVGYSVPVYDRGVDPTTEMELDPKPRLDLRIGNVWSVTKEWDLFAEIVIIDRGDLESSSTRLPMLDGGFDQRHVVLGVTRHFAGAGRPPPQRLFLAR